MTKSELLYATMFGIVGLCISIAVGTRKKVMEKSWKNEMTAQ